MRRALGLVVVVLSAVVGCNHSHTPSPPAHGGPPSQVVSDPLKLVGSWHVSAPGEASGTSLILAADLRLFISCGLMQGGWSADRYGDFIADTWGGDGACFAGNGHAPPDITWLRQAVSYRVEGPDRLLLDADHRVVARLSPGAYPRTGPDDDPSFASPPAITSEISDRLSEPPTLPTNLVAANRTDVLGRWRAVGRHAGNPKGYVEFAAGGQWTGSDGCNRTAGRYVVGPAGEMLTTSGPNTLIGCNNSQAPYWIGQARRVGINNGRLVLFDRTGKKLGTLVRT